MRRAPEGSGTQAAELPAPIRGGDRSALGGALRRALGAVARRLRWQRALDTGTTLALAGLGVAALALSLAKTGDARAGRALLWVAAGAPLAGIAAGALRPVSPLLCARLLDRVLGASDLIASAWTFSARTDAARTPFMRACIDSAERSCAAADPVRALPFRRPKALAPAALLSVCVALLAALQPAAIPRMAARRPPPKPRLLQSDDLEAFREQLAPLMLAQREDPALQAAAAELNGVIEALSDQQLERARALGELRELERKLDAMADQGERERLDQGLRELAQRLEHAALAAALSDALRDADAERARAELAALAEKLRRERLSDEARKKLAEALARARDQRAQSTAQQRLAAARAEMSRLLKRAQEKTKQDPEAERLLQKKRRELDRLEREQAEREQTERELDRLERELEQAGQGLGQGQGQRQGQRKGAGESAAQHLERAAQALENAARQQTSEQQRRRLREQVQQLRELISKQKAGGGGDAADRGSAQALDLRRFSQAARGEPESGGKNSERGRVLMPGQNRTSGDSSALLLRERETRQLERSASTQPGTRGGKEAGEGGRPGSLPEPSEQDAKHVDVRVQGDRGEGPSRSQVIDEAGQHGFASRAYQRVHGDYERNAETVLERDRVPGGYRFYVRRYFQLIRPREASDER